MATEVVAARRRIIRRPRLTSMLDGSSARIRLLVAPAGYGKTTLAREWLGEPERRGIWYRGGPATADVAALAAGVAESVATVVPDAGKRMRERLRATGHPEEDVEILAELFAEDVQQWPREAWLAFDDYQFAMESAASERFVDLLTQQTPIQMLITSRRRPSWATARRILYGEILEIDRRALAMEDSEGLAIFENRNATIDALLTRARGWPAVLGLASLAGEFEIPTGDLPDALYDYFAEELYQAVDPSVQSGLERVAVLPAVTYDLASALLEGQAIFTLHEGLRIGAITKTGQDLELHPLLREFLLSKFSERSKDEVQDFVEEAVRLLTSDARWDEAFEVITRLSAPRLLVRLLINALEGLLLEGRTQTVSQWLEYAGSNHIQSPIIDLAESEVAFRQGQYARAEALALYASEDLDAPDLTAKAFIRAAQAAMLDSRDEDALRSFRLARNSAESDQTRLEALVGECFAALELGPGREAEELFAALVNLPDGSIEMKVRRTNAQLVRAARLGGIGSALHLAAETHQLLKDVRDPLVVTSFLHTYAHLLVLGARYQEALRISRDELEVAQRYRLQFVLPHALLVDAIAHSGLRDFAKALAQIDAAENVARHRVNLHIAMYSAALRARIAISKADFRTALTQTSQVWERPGSPAMRAEYLGYRCLASACVGDVASTQDTASQIQSISGRGLEAPMLATCSRAILAVAEQHREATTLAADAFRAVEDSGAFDSFVIAVRGFPPLLTAVLGTEEYKARVSQILSQSNDFKLARSAGLVLQEVQGGPAGNLTRRELEVARLVAQGHTNREIASRLYISDSTVKVHVRHILEKLGARSRTEVAARMSAMA